MATNDDLKKDLIALASDVAKEAKNAEAFSDKIDALKTLTAVYATLSKHKGADDDEDHDGFDFSKGIAPEEPTHDGTVRQAVSTGNRRRPS